MDTPSPTELQVKTRQDPEKSDPRSPTYQFISRVVYAPIQLVLVVLSRGLAVLRPFAPQLIPLVICILLVPLVLFFSASAGWIVWRSVAVGWESPLYLQYGDGIPPYANIALPTLVPKQRYDISLHLVIPATDSNFALGNFMTSLTLSTHANKTLTYTRRPAIALPPRVSILSSKPRVINIKVPLLTSYAAGTSRVIANVELGRRDSWKSLGHGEGREISVLSASLRGVLIHHGIRGLVTRFPLIFAFVSTITFLVISLLFLGAFILPAVLRPKPEGIAPDTPLETVAPPPPTDARDSSSDGDEKPPRRTRRARPSRSSSRRNSIKAEVPTTTIPSAGSEPAPLRRRRSRLSEPLSDSDA